MHADTDEDLLSAHRAKDASPYEGMHLLLKVSSNIGRTASGGAIRHNHGLLQTATSGQQYEEARGGQACSPHLPKQSIREWNHSLITQVSPQCMHQPVSGKCKQQRQQLQGTLHLLSAPHISHTNGSQLVADLPLDAQGLINNGKHELVA